MVQQLLSQSFPLSSVTVTTLKVETTTTHAGGHGTWRVITPAADSHNAHHSLPFVDARRSLKVGATSIMLRYRYLLITYTRLPHINRAHRLGPQCGRSRGCRDHSPVHWLCREPRNTPSTQHTAAQTPLWLPGCCLQDSRQQLARHGSPRSHFWHASHCAGDAQTQSLTRICRLP